LRKSFLVFFAVSIVLCVVGWFFFPTIRDRRVTHDLQNFAAEVRRDLNILNDNDANDLRKWQAVRRLAKMDSTQALDLMIDWWSQSENPQRKVLAMESLGFFNESAVVNKILNEGLSHERPGVRKAALSALSKSSISEERINFVRSAYDNYGQLTDEEKVLVLGLLLRVSSKRSDKEIYLNKLIEFGSRKRDIVLLAL
jgi:hypothetical protein